MIKRWIALMLTVLILLPVGALSAEGFDFSSIIQYEYGDMFDVPLYDAAGGETALPDVPTLIVYSSDGCGACLTLISQMRALFEVFGTSYVKPLVLWQDDIPADYIELWQLPMAQNLSLAGANILGFSPTIYIVDAEGMVLYRDNDMDRTVEKLLSMGYFPDGYLAEQADRYQLARMNAPEGKTPLLYFSMTGCPDCLNADRAMEADPRMEAQFHIDRLYRYNETDQEKWADYFKLMATVYGVTWYPSFLVFRNGASTLIGETPVETLCDTLAAAVE